MAMKREERAGGRGSLEFETTTLTRGSPFVATSASSMASGRTRHRPRTKVASAVKADAAPHHLVVSHYTARGETLFFVDGKLAGSVSERLEPKRFARRRRCRPTIRDLLIYRSALNADEVAALESGTLLQASLEVYSPLARHSSGRNWKTWRRA